MPLALVAYPGPGPTRSTSRAARGSRASRDTVARARAQPAHACEQDGVAPATSAIGATAASSTQHSTAAADAPPGVRPVTVPGTTLDDNVAADEQVPPLHETFGNLEQNLLSRFPLEDMMTVGRAECTPLPPPLPCTGLWWRCSRASQRTLAVAQTRSSATGSS